MHDFEQTARPVIFEHPDDAFPYWGKGSSMLLANSQHCFWITASHVLTNLGGSVEALRIFPSDDARISLPFNAQYTIKTSVSEDEDHRDVFALRINIREFEAFGDAPLIAQDTELGLLPAEDLKVGTVLWIIGYPAEQNSIDYEQAKIKNSRAVIRAVYQGATVSDHCHVARVNSSIFLETYDGLSGSPVFYLHPVIHNGQELLFPRVVGMLLRGTASSNLVHFVSARVIGELIDWHVTVKTSNTSTRAVVHRGRTVLADAQWRSWPAAYLSSKYNRADDRFMTARSRLRTSALAGSSLSWLEFI